MTRPSPTAPSESSVPLDADTISATPDRWLVAAAAVLLGLFLMQAPGKVSGDSKIDLYLTPTRFAGRALHGWDPLIGFGQVQDQFVGFLIPSAPFYSIAAKLGVSPWVAQRLWWTGLCVIGMWGAVRVADALGVATPGARLVGGFIYGTSPVLLIILGSTSVAGTGHALLPWVLLPLIHGSTTGSILRPSMLSVTAVVLMGGANAAATAGALVLPAIFLLCAQNRRWRSQVGALWVGLIIVASLWWLLPLNLLIRYGFDFTTISERAADTAAHHSGLDLIGGTGNWLAWLRTTHPLGDTGPFLTGNGWVLFACTASGLAGLIGLAHHQMPGRRFLRIGLAILCLAVGAGYTGPTSAPMRAVLDGPGGAFRNLFKLEPGIRLALALGCCHLLGLLSGIARPRALRRAAGGVLAGTLSFVSASPLVFGHVAVPGGFTEVPAEWQQLADYLRLRGGGAAILVPGADFAEYAWGRPMEEPFQALAETPWITRNLVPLSGLGPQAFLDAVETDLARGAPAPHLAETLRRAGIQFVVARNNVQWRASNSPRPFVVRQTLSQSGLTLAASFGQARPIPQTNPRLLDGLGLTRSESELPPIEVWEIPERPGRLRLEPLADAVVVAGPTKEALSLIASGQLNRRPVISEFSASSQTPNGLVVGLTDANRRQEVSIGVSHLNRSYTLAEGEATGRSDTIRPSGTGSTTAAYVGITGVTATTYSGPLIQLPETLPFAAIDGDPATAWIAGGQQMGEGEHLTIELQQPTELGSTAITVAGGRRAIPTRLSIAIDNGPPAIVDVVKRQAILPASVSGSTISIELIDVDPGRDPLAFAGIAEVEIPGVTSTRWLVTPKPPSTEPIILRVERETAPPSSNTGPDIENGLRRVVGLPTGDYRWQATGRVRSSAALLSALAPQGAVSVDASSTFANLAGFAPWLAYDNNPATAWIADFDDDAPTLSLTWATPQRIDRLEIAGAIGPASPPTGVVVTDGVDEFTVPIAADGGIALPRPLRTNRLKITLTSSDPSYSINAAGGSRTRLPVGVAEIRVPALVGLGPIAASFYDPIGQCGDGPDISLDGQTWKTAPELVRGTAVAGNLVNLVACGDAAAMSKHGAIARIVAQPTVDWLLPEAVTVIDERIKSPAVVAPRSFLITRSGQDSKSIEVGPGRAAVLTLPQPRNRGWRATLQGRDLEAVTVDGWQQGFIVPADVAGTITASYEGSGTHRRAAIGGLFIAFGLIVVSLILPTGRRPMRFDDQRPAPWPWAAAVGGILSPLALIPVICCVLVRRRPRGSATATITLALGVGLVAAAALHRIGDPSPAALRLGQLAAAVCIAVAVLGLTHPAVPADLPAASNGAVDTDATDMAAQAAQTE